jgi:energy-coupling factor transporter ATP-binding protein EcfA2
VLARTIAAAGVSRATFSCRRATSPAAISGAWWRGANAHRQRLLVAAYPSRGLDVGAINSMLRYLAELRDAGVAVALFSEELEELFNLSDRLVVLYEGRIMGDFPVAKADLETVGLLMGGQVRRREAEVA